MSDPNDNPKNHDLDREDPKLPAVSDGREIFGRAGTPVQITLNAVLAALDDGQPRVLCTRTRDGTMALPYGPFDPRRHRTFEIGLREWVTRQTKVSLGYVEQLYTFGDRGREGSSRSLSDQTHAQSSGAEPEHLVSVGYLALATEPALVNVEDGRWRTWYRFFPWEDWRTGVPPSLTDQILPSLIEWIEQPVNAERRAQLQARLSLAFGLNEFGWEEERILERFELMYEAGLVSENADRTDASPATGHGLAMASDHRRILATAIARLRGKLKYRPVIFEMMPATFTLYDLQQAVEAIIGFAMHKQNFRRSVTASGLVENTGQLSDQTGGRPAALFQVNRAAIRDRAAHGLVIPRLKQRPDL